MNGIRLRPVTEEDLVLHRRFATEPWLIGLDWGGFRDARAARRRFDEDGFLGPDDGQLIVAVDPARLDAKPADTDTGTAAEADADAEETSGLVSWRAGVYAGQGRYWEIGIALLPEFRGRGIGWRAQAMLCDYLFAHTPVQRIQAATHAENLSEQRSLSKAGFQHEGVVRAAEFRDGQWRDGFLYSRLRTDPAPGL